MDLSASGVDIVIVNWNAGDHLTTCIRTLGPLAANAIIVDNASSDHSIARIRHTAATILHLDRNYGYGTACNRGASVGSRSTILFLNPDTEIDEAAISALYEKLWADPGAAIIGPGLCNRTGQLAASCSHFPRARDLLGRMIGADRLGLVSAPFIAPPPGRVDQVMGACLMIKRPAFESIGGFDEDYFLYFEEVDLSLRLSKAGMDTIYWPLVRAIHTGHGSSAQVKGPRLGYWLTSRLIFARTHFGLMKALLIACTSLCIEPVTRSMMLLASKRRSEIGAALAGYLRYATNVLPILRGTRR